MKQLICILSLILGLGILLPAQIGIPSRSEITAELEKRNIDPVEFERRLNQKGVILEDIDATNPAELQRIQTIVDEVIADMSRKDTSAETMDTIPSGMIPMKDTLIKVTKEEVLTDDIDDESEMIEETQEELPEVKTWGQQIFRNKQLEYYQTASSGNPPANYILGVGDKLNVSIFGLSQESLLFEINEAGYILPPRMQRIYLKGLTFQSAKKLLDARFKTAYRYRTGEFDVTLSSSRNVGVSIFGEVFNFGTFNIPARNTAFNALVASGGPTNIGSVRNIKLIRSGEAHKTIDIYQFLLDPSVQDQFYIQDGDKISVPVAETLIAIKGAVNRPMQYELVGSEGLKQLIDFAGGAKVNGYLESVQIIRTTNGRKEILSANVAGGRDFQLQNGDVVNILELDQQYENFVTTEGGGFVVESDFQLRNNMTVDDLIRESGIKADAALDAVFLERMNLDSTIYYEKLVITRDQSGRLSTSPNLNLLPQDKLIIYQQRAFATNKTIEIKGAVRNPGIRNFDQSQKFKAADLIKLSGGVMDDSDDKAYILRSDINNPKIKSYISFNISDAMSDKDNPVLQPDDVITIYKASRYADDYKISVEGAVRSPGEFPFGRNLKLEDAINIAGGLRLEASAAKIEVMRVNIDDTKSTETVVANFNLDKSQSVLNSTEASFELMPFDKIIVREVPDFELQEFINLTGEVKYPGKYALLKDNESLVDIIGRAGGLTAEAFPEGATMYRNAAPENGYVILDLEKAMLVPNSKFNQVVKQGDIIDIPKIRGLVSIETSNTNAAELYGDELGDLEKFSVTHLPGRGVKYYLDEYVAGVNNLKGLKRKVTVRQANGRLDRTKKILFVFNSYPRVEEGSTIIVGDKPLKEEKYKDPNRERIDWGKVAVDTLSVATSALSLILLVDRLNQ